MEGSAKKIKIAAGVAVVILAIAGGVVKYRQISKLRNVCENETQAGYKIAEEKVYYCGAENGLPAKEMAGADVRSFEILDATYARDGVNVYKSGEVMEGEDPALFEADGE